MDKPAPVEENKVDNETKPVESPAEKMADGSRTFSMPCGCSGKVDYCQQHNSHTALSACDSFYRQGLKAEALAEALRAIGELWPMCPNCGDSGTAVGSAADHDPSCDGSCVRCPIEVQIQVECPCTATPEFAAKSIINNALASHESGQPSDRSKS